METPTEVLAPAHHPSCGPRALSLDTPRIIAPNAKRGQALLPMSQPPESSRGLSEAGGLSFPFHRGGQRLQSQGTRSCPDHSQSPDCAAGAPSPAQQPLGHGPHYTPNKHV